MGSIIRNFIVAILVVGTLTATVKTAFILHNNQVIRNDIALKQQSSSNEATPQPTQTAKQAHTSSSSGAIKTSPSTANSTSNLAQLKLHNSSANCWIAIAGKIYSVSSFLNQHPGGAGAIVPYCGKDATTAFETHGRPGGSNHSAYAYSLLPSYYVAPLSSGGSAASETATAQSPTTGKFSPGSRVEVTNTSALSVRATANGTLLGKQGPGSSGTVVEGPIVSGGYTWWKVNFDSGVDGWVAQDYIQNITSTVKTTAPTTYTLSVIKTGTGLGTVSGGSIACGATCSAAVNTGTSVTLTATPASSSTFSGWTGACSGTSTCTVTVNANQTVTAIFDSAGTPPTTTYTLSVTSPNGTVTSNPAGISCGSTCSTTYTQGTSVTLTASPTSGYTFSSWSGACSGASSCTVTMNSSQSVVANYTPTGGGPVTHTAAQVATHNIQSNCWIIISGKVYNVTNFITSHPGGVNAIVSRCGTDATTAFTTSGGGGHAHSAYAQSLLPTYYVGDLTTAPTTYTLSVIKTGTGLGTVSGGSIACGATCSAAVNTGTSVTLTATPASSSTFSGWTGACSGTSTCTVTMNANQTVTAIFDSAGTPPTTTYTLSVTSPNGTVTSNPAGISCGSTCLATYTQGTSVTLTASPTSGYTFSSWSGACSGAGSCTVTMNSSQSVVANYTPTGGGPVTYTIHVTSAGNYDITDLTIKTGDSITFIYSPPISGKVKTVFTPSTISSITLDSEHTQRTETFNAAGTWTFKAKDHNGNQGTLVVQ